MDPTTGLLKQLPPGANPDSAVLPEAAPVERTGLQDIVSLIRLQGGRRGRPLFTGAVYGSAARRGLL